MYRNFDSNLTEKEIRISNKIPVRGLKANQLRLISAFLSKMDTRYKQMQQLMKANKEWQVMLKIARRKSHLRIPINKRKNQNQLQMIKKIKRKGLNKLLQQKMLIKLKDKIKLQKLQFRQQKPINCLIRKNKRIFVIYALETGLSLLWTRTI